MSGNPPACIVLTTSQWIEKCLEKGCTIFDFPPDREPRGIRKLVSGSVCLILVRPAPKTPRSEWTFIGEFTVKSVKHVRGEEFSAYASRAVEVGTPFPKPGEASWIIEFKNLIKYDKPVKLAECTDIKTSTSKEPLSEWVITGFTYIKPEDAPSVVEAIRKKGFAGKGCPSHDELVKELLEIGEWLNFIVKREEPTPDNVYRIDVTWREVEDHAPIKVFEVEVSGDVDKALIRLAHAHDKWRCEQLWLIVSDEAKAERAKKLIEPRLKGSFARIKDKVKILSYKELHNMYTSLKSYKELLISMSKRL
jgi:hypothetical protein